jgi:hypothetical protein
VFADEVAAPLGLTSTYWINTNSMQQRPANPHMSVGCISTPGDLCAVTCMLANGGRLPANHSSSSSSGEVLLQPQLFEELVKLQSAGDPQDLSWAFACVHNGQPIPAGSLCRLHWQHVVQHGAQGLQGVVPLTITCLWYTAAQV